MPINDGISLNAELSILFLLIRYCHIVGAMLLVGGILFYELVLPIAISDLKAEAQAAVFARARWVFRWVIWSSVLLIFYGGIGLSIRRMNSYIEAQYIQTPPMLTTHTIHSPPRSLQAGWWWAAHASSGFIAVLIALYLSAGDRPPIYPVGWLRLDLMILLIVVFFATATYQINVVHQERMSRALQHVSSLHPTYTTAPVENVPLPAP